jgi:Protein of unknown function (DUF3800)
MQLRNDSGVFPWRELYLPFPSASVGWCFHCPAPPPEQNLLRLLYLDEAGIDRGASHICVAGVIVHGDHEWPEIDRRIAALIDKYIQASDQLDFVFHTTDLFHGSEYFDRRKPEWTRDIRNSILADIARIIEDLQLPVVFGQYEKDKFGAGVLSADETTRKKAELMHRVAVIDCLLRADKWLARYSPTEVATVVHEDGVPSKRLTEFTVRMLRSAENLAAEGFPDDVAQKIGLPLKRIIDTVHFAEKSDARPLQLADF